MSLTPRDREKSFDPVEISLLYDYLTIYASQLLRQCAERNTPTAALQKAQAAALPDVWLNSANPVPQAEIPPTGGQQGTHPWMTSAASKTEVRVAGFGT